MERVDAFAIAAGEQEPWRERPSGAGWYDPDSAAFDDGSDWAIDARLARTGGTRRLEIGASLPDEA